MLAGSECLSRIACRNQNVNLPQSTGERLKATLAKKFESVGMSIASVDLSSLQASRFASDWSRNKESKLSVKRADDD